MAGRFLHSSWKRRMIISEDTKQQLALARFTFTLNSLERCGRRRLINESVTEDPDLKKKVWKHLEEIGNQVKTYSPQNTSLLLPSMLRREFRQDGPRFCAFLLIIDVFYFSCVDIIAASAVTDPDLTVPLIEKTLDGNEPSLRFF